MDLLILEYVSSTVHVGMSAWCAFTSSADIASTNEEHPAHFESAVIDPGSAEGADEGESDIEEDEDESDPEKVRSTCVKGCFCARR